MRSKMLLGLAAIGLAAGSGCQTYFAGQTLPSPRYLDHYPQYFQQDPAFPLQKELNSMLDDGGAVRAPAAAAPAAALGGAANPGMPTPR
ncbi:MAG: hypothetical protein U0798_14465 [Gemmataceae bacterium]